MFSIGNSNATVTDFLEHEGKLYVAGQFQFAGGITSSGIAVWDGNRWCGTGIYSVDGGILKMEVYHDSLFVACNRVLYGDSVFNIAKIAFKDIVDTCGEVVTGIEPHPVYSHNPVQVYPNPVVDFLIADLSGIKDGKVEILSITGQKLTEYTIDSGEMKYKINVSGLSPGIYFLKASSKHEVHTFKFVKQ
ncbi:MAG: T9SS type A sorting domain-containing protein [Bacteroidia bacterium]